ncbi:uncharacterized protein LOC142317882 [Lycorma delicatula]|uniref:uncharacterized protein LOC142317882 n=1 Tax=Lycorma delicatula TaxID=130591 RepID=UPI003F511F7C
MYKIDALFAEKGHNSVLRLPPYHLHLNLTVMKWADIKNYVVDKNVTFKLDDYVELVQGKIGVSEIILNTANDCENHTDGNSEGEFSDNDDSDGEISGIEELQQSKLSSPSLNHYQACLHYARVREGFMRQFVYEMEDDENESTKKMCDVFDSKVVYRKQRSMKLLNRLPKIKHVTTELRKASITYIIKTMLKIHSHPNSKYLSLLGRHAKTPTLSQQPSGIKIDSVQLKEEELLEIMNNQNTSLTIEEFNLVKPENLKVENEVKSEISLNDDIPPRINLKINDVHTIKAEEEEEFLPGHKIDSVQLKEEELLEIMNNQNTSLTIEEFNLVKPENLKVENEVKSEISLNDDIPPRINLKINDVHTIKAEEEEEFLPGHQVDLLQLKEELLDIEKDHLVIEDTNLNKTENLEVKNEVKINLEQLKEELDIMSSDNEKRSLSTEDTNLVKSENLKVENEMESDILLNDDVSPHVNLNMKSNELRIKDFRTVKTKDGMVFYPCRVIIDKLTITASTNNCKRCVNNSVYGGIIKQKTSECKCANGDLRTENLVKDISNENELPQHKGKKLKSEISLNDDIPPRINLKINDVHTIKAEEEEEFLPGHQVDLLQLKEELLDIEKDHLAIEDTNLNKTENLEVKNEVKINLEQLKEELDIMSSDNEKRSLSTEDTNLVKSENLKVENEMVSVRFCI